MGPITRSLDITDGRCPDGWKFSDIREGGVAETCTAKIDGHTLTVTLYPHAKEANYGMFTDYPARTEIIPCKALPRWPQDRCLND